MPNVFSCCKTDIYALHESCTWFGCFPDVVSLHNQPHTPAIPRQRSQWASVPSAWYPIDASRTRAALRSGLSSHNLVFLLGCINNIIDFYFVLNDLPRLHPDTRVVVAFNVLFVFVPARGVFNLCRSGLFGAFIRFV